MKKETGKDQVFPENFSALEVDEVMRLFHSGEYGLSSAEARKRLSEYGKNELPEGKREGVFSIFFRQFRSPLIFVLLLAGITVFLLGDTVDSIAIFFVLFFNATIGALQEGRAQNTFLALKKFIEGRAFAMRDGEEVSLSDALLVPGDIIFLREGEKVPADARLLSSLSLRVNEAAFTGESLPKHKSIKMFSGVERTIAERSNMVFKGTTVVSGSGKAIVVSTGIKTEMGNIAQETLGIDADFPLKKDIAALSNFVILFVVGVSFVVLFLSLFDGKDFLSAFKTIVALAVSVIPEGLPIMITLVLAHGVWRMGKKNVLVKKLQAIEVLGETSILAVDKTGTITKNELSTVAVLVDGKRFSIEGSGYSPEGGALFGGSRVASSKYPELLLAGKMAAIGGSATLIRSAETGLWSVAGDPTEGALFVLAKRLGFDRETLFSQMPKVDELPFDYERKFHTVSFRNEGVITVLITGSPEAVIALCERIFLESGEENLSQENRDRLFREFESLSAEGLRVIAFAFGKSENEALHPDHLPLLTFGGFFGIRDSIRNEVRRSVERVEEAGMRVVMITGDAALSARAIALEAGILSASEETVVSGEQIDAMSDEELAKATEWTRVFARVTPAHKLRIIEAYRFRGHIVAMTGDGVNDALSLRAADIGIGMGVTGTEVAKEAADVILLDDNFASIVYGAEEGRAIFFTIRRVILYLFSTSLAEVLVIVGALLIGFPMPILAAQILWLNLVTDVFLDMALALERHSLEKKKFVKTTLIDGSMIWRMIFLSMPMAIGTLFLFSRYMEEDIVKACTISLATLAAFQWFNAWNCRSRNRSVFSLGLFSNPFLIGATALVVTLQLLAFSVPFLQNILRTVPLSFDEWMMVIAVSSSVFFLEEMRKFFARFRYRRQVLSGKR